MEGMFCCLGMRAKNQQKTDKKEREWLFWDGKSCTLAVEMSPLNVP